ncbi:uncharacterized protein PITG_18697 [Phytophthora infestans T30-4]|uniref:Uncharacterized protein n=1 Tax=Phytophthora infestans (strain T30-4) TaxID=403677 RepID=D0NZ14_PHYIT|nr:uncharacterized protein PITG_18697 [Phytophthora infestans T30-4]EEY68801.1 hypothetical protein PITG_18697 [Phytophthora infestans T30-4]|eukprot:XP_002997351.1 hypothetical protein PITG_18697 [Phytophthora infestans T30-4]
MTRLATGLLGNGPENEICGGVVHSNECICVLDESAFRDYKFIVKDMYKKMKSIQKYQLFKMRSKFTGVVEYRTLPTDGPVLHDFRRVYDQVQVDTDHAKRLIAVYLKVLPRPQANAEKATQPFTNSRPWADTCSHLDTKEIFHVGVRYTTGYIWHLHAFRAFIG